MTLWIHSTILATSLAATVAIGIASAAIYTESPDVAAVKTDKLQVLAASDANYVTIEKRAEGISTLARVPAVN